MGVCECKKDLSKNQDIIFESNNHNLSLYKDLLNTNNANSNFDSLASQNIIKESINDVSQNTNIIQKVNDNEITINFILLGDTAVGKSSLIIRYTEGRFDNFHIVSIYEEKKTKRVKFGDKYFVLNFLVTAGHPTYKKDYSTFYQTSDFLLYVFDFNNAASLDHINNLRNDIKNTIPNVTQAYVGNKSDSKQKKINSLETSKFCKNNNIEYFEVSAKNNTNIDRMFSKLCVIFKEKIIN